MGKLEHIINECPIEGDGTEAYNPPCNCNHILTENSAVVPQERYVIAMSGGSLLMKPPTLSILNSWSTDPPLDCSGDDGSPTGSPPTASPPSGECDDS